MARKKQIIINEEELTPTVLGEVTHKKTNLIPVLLMFILFIGIVIGLPYIQEFIDNGYSLTPPPEEDATFIAPTEEDTTDDDEDTGNTFLNHKYDSTSDKIKYVSNSSLTLDSLTVTGININGNTITFNNPVGNLETDYYVEVFSGNDIINRIAIQPGVPTVSVTNDLISTTTDIRLVKIVSDNYGDVKLLMDENNIGMMICENDYTTNKYTFENNVLINVESSVKMDNVVENEAIKATYSNNATMYDALNGVTATFTEDDNTFNYMVKVDILNTRSSDLVSLAIIKEGTPEEIRFEEESSGLGCR